MGTRSLRVALIRDGRIIEDRTFSGRTRVTVGTDERCTFLVPLADVPAQQALFELEPAGAKLLFDAKTEGRVALEGAEQPLQTLAPQAPRRRGRHVLPLPDTARGRLVVGEVSLLFQFVEPLKAPTPATLPRGSKGLAAQLDRLFLVVLGLSLAAHFAGAGWLSAQPVPVERDLGVDEQVERWARVTLPPPRTKPLETRPPEAGKPTGPKVADAKPDAAPAAPKKPAAVDVGRAVRRLGLIGVIGGKGADGAFGDILKDTGADVARAMGEVGQHGLAVANVEDAVAGQRKGDEHGRTSDIELTGTEGVRRVDLQERGPVAVVGHVQSEPIDVAQSELDAQALTRWLNQRKPAVQSCYERELKRNPALAGRLVIHFGVGARGRVEHVGFSDDTLGSAAVQQCISALMRGWVLPFAPEDEVPVALPFIFSASR